MHGSTRQIAALFVTHTGCTISTLEVIHESHYCESFIHSLTAISQSYRFQRNQDEDSSIAYALEQMRLLRTYFGAIAALLLLVVREGYLNLPHE